MEKWPRPFLATTGQITSRGRPVVVIRAGRTRCAENNGDPMYFVVFLLALLPAASVILEAMLGPHGEHHGAGRERLRVLGLRRAVAAGRDQAEVKASSALRLRRFSISLRPFRL